MKLIKGEFKEMLKGWGSPPQCGVFLFFNPKVWLNRKIVVLLQPISDC